MRRRTDRVCAGRYGHRHIIIYIIRIYLYTTLVHSTPVPGKHAARRKAHSPATMTTTAAVAAATTTMTTTTHRRSPRSSGRVLSEPASSPASPASRRRVAGLSPHRSSPSPPRPVPRRLATRPDADRFGRPPPRERNGTETDDNLVPSLRAVGRFAYSDPTDEPARSRSRSVRYAWVLSERSIVVRDCD